MQTDFLHDYWYIACLSKQLKQKPIARQILGQHIVLFRDAEGKAGALLDRCPHRNLALSRGRVIEHGLQCAYHGWTYNRDGLCTLIPAECDPGNPQSKKQIKMQAFAVRELQGFVWVFMGKQKGASAHKKSAAVQNVEPGVAPIQFPLYDDPQARHWVMERVFEGNALYCAENFLDVPHTIFVHAGIFRNESGKELDFEVTAGQDWVQAEFFDEGAFDTFLGRLLIPRGTRMVHTDRFILPTTTRVDYYFTEQRQFVVMSQCTPVTHTKTRVFTYMAFRFDPAPLAWLVQKIYEPLSNRILDQDVVVIREQKDDMDRFATASFQFHATDAIGREIFQLVQGKKLPGHIRRARMRI